MIRRIVICDKSDAAKDNSRSVAEADVTFYEEIIFIR